MSENEKDTKIVSPRLETERFDPETGGTVPHYSARRRYIAWTCMERVFFILTFWPSKIEMKKHPLHESPGDAA
jgi:hypothetical protein